LIDALITAFTIFGRLHGITGAHRVPFFPT
jgi:hypothetical protein